ncbi:xylosidase/arabinosidase [Planoprotostelium fungivorum]|uniref:Xylosidase/arabinosidase n=1 Tax=Planoprotostelium fungivorum TaxID=1890364 RepID=A0A2P6NXL9_9EUKA|nr:xylosidase/arabinosidase [Planoprotostelium fungivorum]
MRKTTRNNYRGSLSRVVLSVTAVLLVNYRSLLLECLYGGSGGIRQTLRELTRREELGHSHYSITTLVAGYTQNQNLPNDPIGGYGTWGDVTFNTNSFPYIDRNIFAKARLYPIPRWNTTMYDRLGNGDQALVYSGIDPAVADIHMQLFRQYGIHAVSVERFLTVATSVEGSAFRNLAMANTNASAAKFGRLFYAGYDLSGCENNPNWVYDLQKDFNQNVKRYTTASHYARHYGKAVVQLYVGTHNISSTDGIRAVRWLQAQNYSVILIGTQDFRADYNNQFHWDLFSTADIYQTWCSGDGPDDILTGVYQQGYGDAQWCQERKIDYMFLVCSGDGLERGSDHVVRTINTADAGKNLKYYSHMQVLDRLRRDFAGNISVGGFVGMADDFPESETLVPSAASTAYLPGGKPYWWMLDNLGRSPDFNLRLTASVVRHLSNGTVLPSQIDVPNGTMPAPFNLPTIDRVGEVISGDANSSVISGFASVYEAIGCYRDGTDELWAGNVTTLGMTYEQCSSFCATQYFTPYAGLSGDRCKCGYVYGSLGPSTSCSLPCSGN